jgi:electron transfer flavoprotein alpha subunit
MTGNVFVIVEQWRGQISAITYEVLALGRELADQSLAPLQAVLLGHNVRDMACTLGRADSVLHLDHPLLADPLPEVRVETLVGALAGRKAQCILCPMTNMSLGMEALLADRLGMPSVSLCRDLRIVANDYEAACVLYGGRIEVVVSLGATPAVFGLWPGARPAHQGQAERRPPIEDVSVSLPEAPAVQLRKYIPHRPVTWTLPIKTCSLVSGGRQRTRQTLCLLST